jgi:hypothetical protein
VDLQDGLLPLLTEREMSQQDGCIEGERIHVLTSRRVDFAAPRQRRTLCLCLGGCNDVWDAHQLQQSLTLLVVLACDPDRPS